MLRLAPRRNRGLRPNRQGQPARFKLTVTGYDKQIANHRSLTLAAKFDLTVAAHSEPCRPAAATFSLNEEITQALCMQGTWDRPADSLLARLASARESERMPP